MMKEYRNSFQWKNYGKAISFRETLEPKNVKMDSSFVHPSVWSYVGTFNMGNYFGGAKCGIKYAIRVQ